jgi:DNA-binding NtrC family response regulator
MQRSFVEIAHACATDVPVLISGPTGSGKTLAARVVHGNSARAAGPFVTLHCAALPEPLLESELFGYEKNAFTGALAARAGHIERAIGGTLFLDEIGDISPVLQAKLLRFVEEKTFTRVGGREDLTADLRLITATHRNLREEVRAGRFREDLYYRLHVLEIELPPLVRRREDLPALCAVFLCTIAPGRPLRLSPETLDLFDRHAWPGNVRELRNALEHAAAVCSGDTIFRQHLSRDFRDQPPPAQDSADLQAALAGWLDGQLRADADYDAIHTRLETLLLRNLMSRYKQKPTVLARALNMNRVTLRKKCRELLKP